MLGKFRDPNLSQIVDVAGQFDVSRAPARAYAEFHEQPLAVAVINDGKVLRIYKNIKFPRISVGYSAPVPRNSLFHLAATRGAELSDISENNAGLWLESEWGKKLPTLYEQSSFSRKATPCSCCGLRLLRMTTRKTRMRLAPLSSDTAIGRAGAIAGKAAHGYDQQQLHR